MPGLPVAQTTGYTALFPGSSPRHSARDREWSRPAPGIAAPPPLGSMYFLYTSVSIVLFAVLAPYFAYQAVRYRKYVTNLRQRFGYLPVSFNLDGEASIWIHAVSVGEALTARALVGDLKARYPRLRLFVSTTTVAGQQVAAREIKDADAVFYFPLDFPFIVNRTLRLVKPRLFVMMETEIWPNLLRACRREGVKTAVANGRISNRSYPRYRLIRPLFRRVLGDVDRFCVQSDESAARLIDLGADPSRVTVTGNLKFDSLPASAAAGPDRAMHRVERFFRVPEGRPVIIAGSTMRGEELMVLRAFERMRASEPRTLLVIAPRHPERFDEVERLARDEGFRTLRRSQLTIDGEPSADVVVLDTIGELAHLYRLATIVFVGGSLVPTGGHNILEPAVYGRPIVFGPHMQNFKEIAGTFLEAGAAVQVRDEWELQDAFRALLVDGARRQALGRAAQGLVDVNHGARERTLDAIARLLPQDEPRQPRPFRIVK
jgi:3-deoxy-D-manno-octulosonic-acid transferase